MRGVRGGVKPSAKRFTTVAGRIFADRVAAIFDNAVKEAAAAARRRVEQAMQAGRATDARLGLALAHEVEQLGQAAVEAAVDVYRTANPLFPAFAAQRRALLKAAVAQYAWMAMTQVSKEMAWTGPNKTVFAKALRKVEARLQAGLARDMGGLIRWRELPWSNRRPLWVLGLGVALGLVAGMLLRLAMPN